MVADRLWVDEPATVFGFSQPVEFAHCYYNVNCQGALTLSDIYKHSEQSLPPSVEILGERTVMSEGESRRWDGMSEFYWVQTGDYNIYEAEKESNQQTVDAPQGRILARHLRLRTGYLLHASLRPGQLIFPDLSIPNRHVLAADAHC